MNRSAEIEALPHECDDLEDAEGDLPYATCRRCDADDLADANRRYKVVAAATHVDRQTLEAHLNFAARDGWRLVLGPLVVGDSAYGTQKCFVFESDNAGRAS